MSIWIALEHSRDEISLTKGNFGAGIVHRVC